MSRALRRRAPAKRTLVARFVVRPWKFVVKLLRACLVALAMLGPSAPPPPPPPPPPTEQRDDDGEQKERQR